jgi:hypothetical protein
LKALWFNLPETYALLFFIEVRLLQEIREMSMCLSQEIRITWYSNVTNNTRIVPSCKALHAKCNNNVFTMQSVIVASLTSRTKTLLQFIRSGDYMWWCWSVSLSFPRKLAGRSNIESLSLTKHNRSAACPFVNISAGCKEEGTCCKMMSWFVTFYRTKW